jgi:hypothetical protein
LRRLASYFKDCTGFFSPMSGTGTTTVGRRMVNERPTLREGFLSK